MAGRLRLTAQALSIALVAGLLGLLVWKIATDEESPVPQAMKAGKTVPAPGFSFERLDRDGRLSLESLRGKVVVINFWASWCGPCKEEAPALEAAWRRHRNRGVVVVGVDVEDVASDARRFARENGLTYPLVHDGAGKTIERYGLTGLPETFFVRRDGKIVPKQVAGRIDEEELEEGIRLALST